jgi:hypothetical protein
MTDMQGSAAYANVGPMETRKGKEWRLRMNAADEEHRKRRAKWMYNRALYLSVYDSMEEVKVWSDTVAMGWSVINAMIDDTYYQNPETLIQARSGDPSGELAKELTDVTNTIHTDADTEGIMRQCMQTSAFAGFALHWAYFEQIDKDADEVAEGEDAEGPDGVKSQRILADYVSPWSYRGDPAGRRWDFKDFKWISRRYRMSPAKVQACTVFDPAKKALVAEWVKGQPAQMTGAPGSETRIDTTGYSEMDPQFQDIWIDEIWDRPNKQIIHLVVGTSIDLGKDHNPWPPSFEDADEFPGTMVAFNRVPEDEHFRDGWWPMPDIQLITDQLEQLNRLNGLFMETATMNLLKYLMVDGLASDDELAKLTSDTTRSITKIDWTKLVETFPSLASKDPTDVNLKNLIVLLSQDAKAELIKFEEGIMRVMNNIAEVLGQGPSSRYGLAPSKTATESAGLQAAKDQRAKSRANQAGRCYDKITEKIWLLLKAHQQLPLDYMFATDGDQAVWRQFLVQKVRDIKLAYRHQMGSSRPKDTQGQLFALKETAQIAFPALQALGQNEAVLEITNEMIALQGMKNVRVITSDARDIAMQLAQLRFEIMNGTVDPTDPKNSHDTSELTSKLLQMLLGEQGMQAVAARVQSQAQSAQQDGGGQNSGTPKGPATSGEAAAVAGGSAAAGAVGGLGQ